MKWLDIKNNPQLAENLRVRGEILRLIRDFFYQKDFLEIDGPLMVRYGNLEPNLDLFNTTLKDNFGTEFKMSLITSPEYTLKKLLAANFHKIYQLSKCFRNNEPWNEGHNSEFTMIEWYETGTDYNHLMNRVEELVNFVAKGKSIEYQGKSIVINKPWLRLSMQEAWKKYANVDLNNFLTRDTMRTLALSKGYTINEDDSFDDLFFKIFLTEIEPQITAIFQPVFLYDYPVQMAALSRVKASDPRYAERVELYIGGFELANGYSELIDFEEQKQRFLQDQKKCRMWGKPAPEIDTDFMAALESGLPVCAGIALGVDRLVMLLTNAKDIGEVVPFTVKDMML